MRPLKWTTKARTRTTGMMQFPASVLRDAGNFPRVIVSPTQDDFPDDGIETEACERKCTTDADCATQWPEFNECGVCQNWGDDPDMECDGTPRPDQPVTIKNAHISLVRVPRPSPSHRVESASVGEIYNIQCRSRTARSA